MESGEAKGEPAYETQALEFPKPQHAHQPLVKFIVNELRGGAESPSKGDNGIRVAQILDTVLSSYYGGRDDAFWDREEQWGGGALVR